MRLYILAAGVGQRLRPLTNNLPKTLIPLADGSCILEKMLAKVRATGSFDQVIVIVGHQAELIEKMISNLNADLNIKTVYNPFYAQTGPAISLWAVHRQLLEDDFVICNGDTLFADVFFREVNKPKAEQILLYISKSGEYQADDIKIGLGKEGRITTLAKNISLLEAEAKSTGFLEVRGAANRQKLVKKILELVKNRNFIERGAFWHDILNEIIKDQVIISSQVVAPEAWFEIDTVENLSSLNEHLLATIL